MTRRVGSAQQDAQDGVLWARLRADDTTALASLIDLYATELRDFAVATVRQSDVAEDVVQDVFVRLWERRATLEIEGSVIAYLYRMTRNVALNVVRHAHAEQRLQAAIEREYLVGGAPVVNDGALMLDDEELRTALDRAIQTLRPQVREIFVMVRLRGMTYAEVADALGIAVVTVRSQLSRAVRRIGEALVGWNERE